MSTTPLLVQLAHAGGLDARQEDRPCAADPDSMFIDWPRTRGDSKLLAEAKADLDYLKRRVCGPCPLRAACLAAAIERDERLGVWGGVDFQRERYALPRTTNMPSKRAA